MSNYNKHFNQLKFTYLGVEYTANVTVFILHDLDYGADADGHRGVSKYFIECIKIEKVIDLIGNEVEKNVWNKMEDDIIEAAYEKDLYVEEGE